MMEIKKYSWISIILFELHCIYSIFKWNNETINVWSHLGGFIIFLYLVLHDNIIYIPKFGGSFTDHIIVTLGLLCYQVSNTCIISHTNVLVVLLVLSYFSSEKMDMYFYFMIVSEPCISVLYIAYNVNI
jgi:hypothetical protein